VQIQLVQTIGTATRQTFGNSSVSIAVPDVGVTAGNTVVVSVETGTARGAVSCRDSRGNTYSVDADVLGVGRLFVCSARLSVALQGGDTITAVYPGFSGGSVASATEFAGITGLEQARAKIGNSKQPSSGAITTTRSGALLLSVISHNGPSVLTSNGSFTLYCRAIVGGGSGQKTIDLGYQLGVPPGTYTAAGTLSGAARWRAIILAYY
jgi:hypothetical protein